MYEHMMRYMADYQDLLSPDTLSGRIVASLVIFVILTMARLLTCKIARRRISDPSRFYHWRRVIMYSYSILAIILIGRIWIEGIDSIATFLGLVSAGLAIALHDTIANLAAWLFIMWFKPFNVGDRVQIGDIKGDVIDTRILQFSLIELGNWVDADMSTGRIVHVPNSRVFREPLANYETGFEYIWHEINIVVTFESNWEKAKRLLTSIAREKAEHLSQGAEEQIRRAAMKYLVYFNELTPIVYTNVKDHGVHLAIRYIVKPRRCRGSEQEIWEAVLKEFAKHDDIELAYPTTRYFDRANEK